MPSLFNKFFLVFGLLLFAITSLEAETCKVFFENTSVVFKVKKTTIEYFTNVKDSPYFSRILVKKENLNSDNEVTAYFVSKKNRVDSFGVLNSTVNFLTQELPSYPLILFGRNIQKKYYIDFVETIYKYGVRRPILSISEFVKGTRYELAGVIRIPLKLSMSLLIYYSTLIYPVTTFFKHLEQVNYSNFVEADVRFKVYKIAARENKDFITKDLLYDAGKNFYNFNLATISNFNGHPFSLRGNKLFIKIDTLSRIDLDTLITSRKDLVPLGNYKNRLTKSQQSSLYMLEYVTLLRQQLIFEYLFEHESFIKKQNSKAYLPIIKDMFSEENIVFSQLKNKLKENKITKREFLETFQNYQRAKSTLAMYERINIGILFSSGGNLTSELLNLDHIKFENTH